MVASSNQQETVMNQTTTHKDSLDACLTLQDHELDRRERRNARSGSGRTNEVY
jgi:hypothetical protein